MPIDYKHYPPNWKTEIRPAILARAENKCEHCRIANGSIVIRGTFEGKDCYQDMDGFCYDATNSEYIGGCYLGEVHPTNKIIKIVLTVAHLDHDKENNKIDLTRLAALCQRCHLRYDLQHHIRNRKYGIRNKTLKLDL